MILTLEDTPVLCTKISKSEYHQWLVSYWGILGKFFPLFFLKVFSSVSISLIMKKNMRVMFLGQKGKLRSPP